MNLKKKDYPKYLKQAYYVKTGEKLNLRHPKTLNEKIQWLKIYDDKPIKITLTDKVLAKNWVKEKIGGQYLKPVLWLGDKFDDIPFDELPDVFIIKCSHGCKWQAVIKDKNKFLENNKLVNLIKEQFDGWLSQSFFGWSDFETQYKDIKPKIIIEPLLRDNLNKVPFEIEIWCFNGKAKIIHRYKEISFNDKSSFREINSYDENLNQSDIKFYGMNKIVYSEPDDIIKEAKALSEVLAKEFKLVRVDWMIYKNKLYFNEMTFTPQSGFIYFPENHNELQLKLGKMINLKGD